MGTSDDLYDQILTDGPSPKTLFLVLSKLKEQGQLERVIQESLRALNSYPNDIHIRRLLAETYFEAGLISQAEAELEKVTQLIGNLTGVYKLQAEIYRKQEREKEATDALELYLAHQPDDQEALHFLNTLKPAEEIPVGEPQPAVEEISTPLEEDIGEEPSAPAEEEPPEIATSTLAELYLEQGQIQEAIDTYEVVVAQNPEDDRSRERLEELKATVLEDAEIEENDFGKLREQKKKMITILESWLANIRDQFNPA
jgi:tetratricopeptide (TPR) repeat protein